MQQVLLSTEEEQELQDFHQEVIVEHTLTEDYLQERLTRTPLEVEVQQIVQHVEQKEDQQPQYNQEPIRQ